MRAANAIIGGTLMVGGYCACFLGGGDAPICPPNLQPTFSSISSEILTTSSCAGTNGSGCHSHEGSLSSGGLDFSTDPYHALLGADGGGLPAENIAGDAGHLLRVAPGDPADSFLVIKLTTTSSNDPLYGSGMPFNAPGSICPSAIEIIEQWIDAGAKND